MKGPNADKAGAVQISVHVFAATDSDVHAREVASTRYLARTDAQERRVLSVATVWLRLRLAGNAPQEGETHLWGLVERGRWIGVTSHGIEDAEFEHDEWPGLLYAYREDDGSVRVEREATD